MTDIIQGIFSHHSRMKSENNNRNKSRTFTNLRKINNTLLNNQWIKKEVTGEITKKKKKYIEMNENGNVAYQNLWNIVKEGDIYGYKCLH